MYNDVLGTGHVTASLFFHKTIPIIQTICVEYKGHGRFLWPVSGRINDCRHIIRARATSTAQKLQPRRDK